MEGDDDTRRRHPRRLRETPSPYAFHAASPGPTPRSRSCQYPARRGDRRGTGLSRIAESPSQATPDPPHDPERIVVDCTRPPLSSCYPTEGQEWNVVRGKAILHGLGMPMSDVNILLSQPADRTRDVDFEASMNEFSLRDCLHRNFGVGGRTAGDALLSELGMPYDDAVRLIGDTNAQQRA